MSGQHSVDVSDSPLNHGLESYEVCTHGASVAKTNIQG